MNNKLGKGQPTTGEQMLLGPSAAEELAKTIDNPEAAEAFVRTLQSTSLLATAGRSDQDFDWSDRIIAVPAQEAIAVYVNDAGSVSLRQEAQWNEESDSVIYIHPSHIDAVIEALKNCKAISERALKEMKNS